MRKITVTIDKDGTINMDMNGYKGEECVRHADKIKQRLQELGVNTEDQSSEKKREFYETEDEVTYESR